MKIKKIDDLKCCGNCDHSKINLENYPCSKGHWSFGHHRKCRDWKYDTYTSEERKMKFERYNL